MKLYRYDKNRLIYKKVNLVLPALILLIIAVGVPYSFVKVETQKIYVQAEKEIELKHKDVFSEEKLIKMINEMPFKYKSIIMAQCILESGNFTSPVFKENNNLLGIRLARQRPTLAIGSNLNHAVYRNFRESLMDRIIYGAMYMNKLSRSDYLKYLDRVYAEAGGYDKVLEDIIRKNKLDELWGQD